MRVDTDSSLLISRKTKIIFQYWPILSTGPGTRQVLSHLTTCFWTGAAGLQQYLSTFLVDPKQDDPFRSCIGCAWGLWQGFSNFSVHMLFQLKRQVLGPSLGTDGSKEAQVRKRCWTTTHQRHNRFTYPSLCNLSLSLCLLPSLFLSRFLSLGLLSVSLFPLHIICDVMQHVKYKWYDMMSNMRIQYSIVT